MILFGLTRKACGKKEGGEAKKECHKKGKPLISFARTVCLRKIPIHQPFANGAEPECKREISSQVFLERTNTHIYGYHKHIFIHTTTANNNKMCKRRRWQQKKKQKQVSNRNTTINLICLLAVFPTYY